MRRIVVMASVLLVPGLPGTLAAQTRVPKFHVDPAWPKVPAKWKLGDASSIAIDGQDRVWVLHRPRTLPADQAALFRTEKDFRECDQGDDQFCHAVTADRGDEKCSGIPLRLRP